MNLLITSTLCPIITSSLLGPNTSVSTLFSNTLRMWEGSFKFVQYNRQSHSSVWYYVYYYYYYVFRWQTVRKNNTNLWNHKILSSPYGRIAREVQYSMTYSYLLCIWRKESLFIDYVIFGHVYNYRLTQSKRCGCGTKDFLVYYTVTTVNFDTRCPICFSQRPFLIRVLQWRLRQSEIVYLTENIVFSSSSVYRN